MAGRWRTPQPVPAPGTSAPFLSSPRRCRALSSRPWTAWVPWTPRAATRWCARCATHSSSVLACWTASTTFAPAACAAAPPTVVSPARCASECLKAPTDTPPYPGEIGSVGLGNRCRAGKALTPSCTWPAPLSTRMHGLPPIIQSRLTEVHSDWPKALHRKPGGKREARTRILSGRNAGAVQVQYRIAAQQL